MNLTRNEWIRIRTTLRNRDIHHDQVKFLNCVRFSPTESKEHRRKKFEICEKLYFEDKVPFLTEAWNQQRTTRLDILDLIGDIDYEIETDLKRKKSYEGDVVIEVKRDDQ